MMSEVIEYCAEQHYNELKSWLAYHDPETVHIDVDKLPARGLIVPGIAAAFFRITDDNCMWLDCAITNPHASPIGRRDAGVAISATIYGIAKQLQVKQLFFLTRSKTIASLIAPLLGAQPIDMCMLYRADYTW